MESRLYEPFMLLERRVLSTIIIQTKMDTEQMVSHQTSVHNLTEPGLPLHQIILNEVVTGNHRGHIMEF